jgi:cytochrome c peroxidase
MSRCLTLALTLVASATLAQARLPAVAPAPKDNPITEEKVALGRLLFFDPRLSADGTLSCESCHRLTGNDGPADGADGRRTSLGVGGRMGPRNAPTVLNSGMRAALFWDGRASSLEEQAKGPLSNPVEMAMPPEAVVAVVEGIPEYRAAFARIFAAQRAPGAGLSLDEIVKVLATYERTLMTPDSPFDRYLAGDASALDPLEQRGWQRFRSLGCIGCHGTPTFSDQDYFIRMPGNPVDDFEYLLSYSQDRGRLGVTGQGRDMNKWRVPSLRNVALTAPYFHNGMVTTLDQAVRIMARVQLRRTLENEEVAELVAFLKTLTGRLPEQQAPQLPGVALWAGPLTAR